MSDNAQKIRQTEGSYINKSLLTLGNVISRLSSQKQEKRKYVSALARSPVCHPCKLTASCGDRFSGHIPFRDSKLTRILEQSLRGNARIAIICTISAAASSFEETHNTLKFASRAKRITNKAKVCTAPVTRVRSMYAYGTDVVESIKTPILLWGWGWG
jgi:centromeric protein E